jgi:hypothetical protein
MFKNNFIKNAIKLTTKLILFLNQMKKIHKIKSKHQKLKIKN